MDWLPMVIGIVVGAGLALLPIAFKKPYLRLVKKYQQWKWSKGLTFEQAEKKRRKEQECRVHILNYLRSVEELYCTNIKDALNQKGPYFISIKFFTDYQFTAVYVNKFWEEARPTLEKLRAAGKLIEATKAEEKFSQFIHDYVIGRARDAKDSYNYLTRFLNRYIVYFKLNRDLQFAIISEMPLRLLEAHFLRKMTDYEPFLTRQDIIKEIGHIKEIADSVNSGTDEYGEPLRGEEQKGETTETETQAAQATSEAPAENPPVESLEETKEKID